MRRWQDFRHPGFLLPKKTGTGGTCFAEEELLLAVGRKGEESEAGPTAGCDVNLQE